MIAGTVQTREEAPGDASSVRRVNQAAFGGDVEADLVERLHAMRCVALSLVAECPLAATPGTRAEARREVVGHILFSPVRVEGSERAGGLLGLGPLAVLPARQRQGIGSLLVREGLHQCRERGHRALVLLGNPHYYSRFGFLAARTWRLRCEFPFPEEDFQALELSPGALNGLSGLVRYAPPFSLAADPPPPRKQDEQRRSP